MNAIIKYFSKPTAQELANLELAAAQKALLEAQTSAEYATNICNYHTARIRRLTKYLADSNPVLEAA